MTAKDLMIGDWVMNTHNRKPEQVCEIRERMVMLDYNDLYDYDEIEPIPLTEEILNKNGFYFRKAVPLCSNSECFEEDEEFRVELSLGRDNKVRWTINCDEYTIMPLDYVHQLQNALRVCEINKEIIL